MNLHFKNWFILENTTVLITVDYSSYIKYLNVTFNKFLEYLIEKKEKVNSFDLNALIQKINLYLKDYPNLNNLLSSINSKNIKEIFNQKNQLTSWGLNNFSLFQVIREIGNLLYIYIDFLNKSTSKNNTEEEEELKKLYSEALEKTQKNLENIKSKIDQAIKKINNWTISNVQLIPIFSEDSGDEVYSISNSAFVKFDNGLSFSLFVHDGKIEIDDILEGGDSDFFKDETSQSNYFELIEELRNPNKKDKILTLYTARPAADREFYSNTKYLPLNIFLADNISHVDGLASDLSSTTKRDVWKIKINSKYLIQTLDSKIKYYQVIKNNAPIESIELVS